MYCFYSGVRFIIDKKILYPSSPFGAVKMHQILTMFLLEN